MEQTLEQPSEEEAATKIQAAFRGMQAREKVKEIKTHQVQGRPVGGKQRNQSLHDPSLSCEESDVDELQYTVHHRTAPLSPSSVQSPTDSYDSQCTVSEMTVHDTSDIECDLRHDTPEPCTQHDLEEQGDDFTEKPKVSLSQYAQSSADSESGSYLDMGGEMTGSPLGETCSESDMQKTVANLVPETQVSNLLIFPFVTFCLYY